jgi:hypothetical protein
VSEDPAFPAPTEGYVEQGFGTPSHWFLHLLLQYYGLELHNLTPSGVLHIAASCLYVRLTYELTLSSICRIISSVSGVHKTRTWS